MSTRCYIAKKINVNDVKYIYCHYDGGQYVSDMLRNHYTEEILVDALLGSGEISSLGPSLGECVIYTRDRGERFNPPEIENIKRFKRMTDVDFYHIYDPETNTWESGRTGGI